jgi:hypothetical protein
VLIHLHMGRTWYSNNGYPKGNAHGSIPRDSI